MTRPGGSDSYQYDADGNMNCRTEGGVRYNQVFDAENRLSVVQILKAGLNCPVANTEAGPLNVSATTRFYYDGQGNQVKRLDPDSSYTVYYFGMYEIRYANGGAQTGETIYYPAGGAMRVDGVLKFILSDQLGSTSVVTNAGGAELGRKGYYPFGKTRYSSGSLSTDRLYTGQQLVAGIGLYNYKARFYDAALGRFISADTITPGGPQGLNRYSYTNNSPINYNDPSGNSPTDGECGYQGQDCGGRTNESGVGNGGNPIIPSNATTPRKPDNQLSLSQGTQDQLAFCIRNLEADECKFDPAKISSRTPAYSVQPGFLNPLPVNYRVSSRFDPGFPDYYSLSINVYVATFSFTADRYGNGYFAPGINVGTTLGTGASGSIVGGYIQSPLRQNVPSESQVESFIQGPTINVSAGYVGGGGITWSPWASGSGDAFTSDHFSYEFGAYIPMAGITGTWGFKIFDAK